jgi:hypothetical protein
MNFIAYAIGDPCDDIPHPDVCPDKDGTINRLYVRYDQQSRGFER